MIKPITLAEKLSFNAVVSHPLQSFEWGEFREKTGVTVIRRGIFQKNTMVGGFQMTIHPLPHTHYTIGYLPKGDIPTDEVIESLIQVGKEHRCIFIQIEPNVTKQEGLGDMEKHMAEWKMLKRAAHPLFTQYTFRLDLRLSEEDLLKNMHPKTRYNIKVAKRHQVQIVEEDSQRGFETYWKLMEETTARQRFFAHSKLYHALMWDTLRQPHRNGLQAHLLLALYQPEQEKKPIPLAAWILFSFHKELYYPYGASSNLYRNVMASNLMMWEAIRFGKKQRLTTFDMWGALGENPDPKDPWFGFHRLKQGYNPTLIEFIGSYDLVINPTLYSIYKAADKVRWMILRKPS